MTIAEITAIVGPVDETFAAEIAQTGASPEELSRAWAWVNNSEALINDGRELPSGRVAELIDLLSGDGQDDEA